MNRFKFLSNINKLAIKTISLSQSHDFSIDCCVIYSCHKVVVGELQTYIYINNFSVNDQFSVFKMKPKLFLKRKSWSFKKKNIYIEMSMQESKSISWNLTAHSKVMQILKQFALNLLFWHQMTFQNECLKLAIKTISRTEPWFLHRLLRHLLLS